VILSTLRARLEAILFEGYGESPYVIATGFSKVSPDLVPLDAPAERRARVRIGGPVPVEEGVNPCDGYALMYRPITVVIEYVRTGAGDLDEGYTALDGDGDDESIEDRMSADEHAIASAFAWHEHWSGLDPHCAEIRRDGASERSFEGAIATLSIPFRALTREQTPGSY
jgi:hypothetical protein